MIQSPETDTALLVFRGTEPTNVINWATDLSVAPERFIEGEVHGGILRNLQAVWPLVHVCLKVIEQGEPLTGKAMKNYGTSQGVADAYEREKLRVALGFANPPISEVKHDASTKLKTLFITGHSLGGAMAALAAAQLGVDGRYRGLREKLSGVYTYGAPMVAVPALADMLDKQIGDRVFRHVYHKDVIPRLPPTVTGRFKHFGQEFTSRGDGEGWKITSKPSTQAALTTSLMSGMGFALAQIPAVGNLLAKLPLSLDHHSPRYYVKISDLSSYERM